MVALVWIDNAHFVRKLEIGNTWTCVYFEDDHYEANHNDGVGVVYISNTSHKKRQG